MSPARALIPSAVASAIWYAFLIAAGSFLGQTWPRARALLEDANRVLAIVATVAAVLAAVLLWRARGGRARS
jgi:membrane protein DedA with SNARE-associated domain